VTLPNGAPARLAMYFPQTKDLRELRPVVERALLEMGYPTDLVLRNTSRSTQAEIDAFNRLNHPASPHRVILLVNKGTEGWDCPSLFACALARKLKTSQNFVLQASTRCLRQVPGNDRKARIYLSMDNRGILDRQLQETYGETVADLNRASQDTRTARLVVRKLAIPPLVVTHILKRVVPADDEGPAAPLRMDRPDVETEQALVRQVFTLAAQPDRASVMKQVDETRAVYEVPGFDLYTAATKLAAVYRLDVWTVYAELKRLYGADGANGTVPEAHLPALAGQIEAQTRCYRVEEEEVEVALALVKPEGFEEERDEAGDIVYTAEITYHKDKEHLLLRWGEMAARNPGDFGFHYAPYNFDSGPEKSFFTQLLDAVNLSPAQVEDVYFTGGLHDPNKTDFFVEYRGEDGRWHRYSPDFVVRRVDGRCTIVEIKAERERSHPVDGEKGRKAVAVRKWTALNPDRLKYEMIFTGSDSVGFNQLTPVREFIETEGG
jgi:hypothetical protein